MTTTVGNQRGARWTTIAACAVAAWALTSASAFAEEKIIVGLITKTNANPFCAKMKEGAAAKAGAKNAAGLGPCLCAGDVEERIQLSQPTISHHMAILCKAGLVEATKRGQWRWYRRNEKAIRLVVTTLRGKL